MYDLTNVARAIVVEMKIGPENREYTKKRKRTRICMYGVYLFVRRIYNETRSRSLCHDKGQGRNIREKKTNFGPQENTELVLVFVAR